MKTLTIKQPWASLICEGIKDIENRTWKTNFRGRVLIHAAASPVKGLPCEVLNDLQYATVFTAKKLDALIGLNSSIIGSVEIVDCVLNHPSIWAEHIAKKWKIDGEFIDKVEVPVYNWVLANPILFDRPIENVKGKLSFWEYANI